MTPTTELLRAAAERARATASAAAAVRPGPWAPRTDTQARGTRVSVHDGRSHVTGYAAPDVVDHIVLWQPAVALAVAVWLEASAELHPPGEDGWGDDHASRVAAALLGEEADREH